jgi:putative PIN family toxin of toxin-antitoxin system
MTKVVIDTSVLVSALLTEHGAEAAVLDGVLDGKIIWCVSDAILAEYEATLYRPKFRGIERRKIVAALRLAASGRMTVVTARLIHSPHEPDNRFYECAQASLADYLVTGNRKHFNKDLPPTKIVNARELLRLL